MKVKKIIIYKTKIEKILSGLSYSDPEDKSLSNVEIEPLLPPAEEDENSKKKTPPPNIPVEGKASQIKKIKFFEKKIF